MIPINPAPIDVFLQPGDVYFGDRHTRLRTILGSCVSITLWHPQRLLGGMCHFILPARHAAGTLDGRYADEAMALLAHHMRAAGTQPREYQAKIFGGGNMLRACGQLANIGDRNIEAARRLLREYGLASSSEHLAGAGHRSIVFDVASGSVWVRYSEEPKGERDVA